MRRHTVNLLTFTGLMVAAATPALASDNVVSADEVISAIEAVFGAVPGERRNHTKGSCAVGEFVGRPAASRYTRSALFSGAAVPVVARLSLSGGNPAAPDTARSGRGMALEFKLPDGSLHHMTMLNVPVFGAAHPQTFLDLMRAMKPDPATGKPDPDRLRDFKASHPDARPLGEYMASHNPPTSYANAAFWGIHSFKFLNTKDETTIVRWRFVPQDGEQALSADELKTAGANFLEKALIERTRRGPVRWDMMLTVGVPGDPEDDPTLAWPSERPEVSVGTLSLHAATPQKGAACEGINFDPLVMSDGIAPTNDPVLLFRSPTYAISFGKRLSGH
ncbi:catalase family peroxidase [Denitromonas ohlonensis]|uniref:Catalase-related peroxidase n=2 Tax=Denitromonas TaxID=139331 RepID=A0A557SE77_9RHOO|nr:catalase family peroxidase [Denitromonas ohlonensis]TVO64969.1 catalase family peroxidase [Denitromonas ohlonensis]TVO75642.1 catalase family peroxidase [Denitromonas ohlonensis]